MITIRTLQKIRAGALTTLFNGIYAVILGFIYIFFRGFILNNNFHSINAIWRVFSKYNPEISAMYLRLFMIKAIFIIAIGITIIYFSSYVLKKKEKTTWVNLFIIGIIFWPSLFLFDIFDKNFYMISLSFIGWISFIIGMLIPIRYYMQKEYTEY